ncbi:PIN domain-containing protein [uncultured Adlercreutzia sp.]|uniref:PIN domain-containing protein n=1 Tax=uncultured Adlercreutzia sp. TaxID=875803 RepID=UPI0025DE7998|nr:PIN domain-containing protein [uncultured Adlercreutzia sp.]MCI9261978.1 PIN domain-containing protein [Eggerthellaceae bacterium]
MRILLDTNVLIDLYTQRPPDGDIAQKLLIMKEFGDAELWVSAKSFTDVFYVLRKTYNSEFIQNAFDESYQWLEICSVDASDIHLASSRKWDDFEDCLIDICAEKIKADYLLTRNESGFINAHVQAVSPADFFNYLQEEYGLVYDFVDFPAED